MHEYQNKEEQKCVAVHQEPVEQEHLKQQLQQAPISEETQQIEQGPLQQLQQMEAAAPMLQIQPAAPAFEELTTGYQQRKRGANQSKRERKQREKKVEAHDIDVCEQKIIKMGEIDRKDREALQKGQFSAQIKDDLTMLQDATHTKREIKSMRKRVPSYGILREDLTGYERRNRSLKFRERLPLRKEYLVQQDVDRLVHNYHVDLYLTEEYRPSPLISKFNDAYQCEPQFSAEDERLQVQKHDLSKKIDSCKDEAEKKKLAQQIEDVNRELKKFQELSLYIKNVAGQHGMQAEVHQVRLKAMENAFKQLELEEQNEPSVYTQAMIENLRARRETLRADIQKEFAEYTNPKLNDSLKPEEVEEKRASFKLMLERVDDMAEAYREKKKHIADGMDPDEAEAAYQAKSLNLIRAYTQAPSAKQSGGDKA